MCRVCPAGSLASKGLGFAVSGVGSPWEGADLVLLSSVLLSSLELSDTQVYEPSIRALLGIASHFCEVIDLVMLERQARKRRVMQQNDPAAITVRVSKQIKPTSRCKSHPD